LTNSRQKAQPIRVVAPEKRTQFRLSPFGPSGEQITMDQGLEQKRRVQILMEVNQSDIWAFAAEPFKFHQLFARINCLRDELKQINLDFRNPHTFYLLLSRKKQQKPYFLI